MRSKLLVWSLTAVGGVALVVGVIVYAFDKPERPAPSVPLGDEPEQYPMSPGVVRFGIASSRLAWDYRDEKVSAAEWLRTAEREIPRMVAAIRVVRSHIAEVEGRERADLRTLVPLARDEIEAVSELRVALQELNPQDERLAFRHWSKASARKFTFLDGYYYRTIGVSADFASLLPSRPLKSAG
jgi:hypothetical protein